MKKIVLILVLILGMFVVSCNKKVETSNENLNTDEQVAQDVIDSTKTDTVAPIVEQKDTISKY